MTSKMAPRIAAWVLAGGVAACGGAGGDDLDAPHGGLDFSQEQPMFGAEHRGAFVAGGQAEEPQALEGHSAPAPDTTGVRHAVWAVWGRAQRSDRPTEATDWSGDLSLQTGVLSLARTLAFDRRDQVLDAPDQRTVAFTSRTRPHVDGLVAMAQGPAGNQVVLHTAAVSLQAQTGSTAVHTSAALEGGKQTAQLIVLPLDPTTCTAALFTAHAMRAAPRPLAALRGRSRIHQRAVGRALDPTGALLGHWRGFSGTRSDGQQVAFGKLVDRDGNALALMEGTPTADGSGFDVTLLAPDHTVAGQVTLAKGSADNPTLPAVADLNRCLK